MREEQIQEAPVKVLLVGVDVGEEPDFERSMEELASLAEAAEKEVAGHQMRLGGFRCKKKSAFYRCLWRRKLFPKQ